VPIAEVAIKQCRTGLTLINAALLLFRIFSENTLR